MEEKKNENKVTTKSVQHKGARKGVYRGTDSVARVLSIRASNQYAYHRRLRKIYSHNEICNGNVEG